MAPTPHEVIQIIREAGHIERCHLVPHVGSYSVATHSWQLVVLLFRLHPAPSLALIRAAVMHDVPERYHGDVPASTKWANPQFAEVLREAEERVLSDLSESLKLDPEEQKWLYYADKLELYLWCHDQWAMGNSNVGRMISLLEERLDGAPEPIQDFLKHFCWRRTNDFRVR